MMNDDVEYFLVFSSLSLKLLCFFETHKQTELQSKKLQKSSWSFSSSSLFHSMFYRLYKEQKLTVIVFFLERWESLLKLKLWVLLWLKKKYKVSRESSWVKSVSQRHRQKKILNNLKNLNWQKKRNNKQTSNREKSIL